MSSSQALNDSAARMARRRSQNKSQDDDSSLYTLLAPVATVNSQKEEISDAEASKWPNIFTKTFSYHKPTPLLLIPYSSEVVPTEYNQRLPEWRVRAGNSAYREHWRNWLELQAAALWTNLGLTSLLGFPMYTALCGKGSFVIVYIIIEFLIGFPLLFLQLAVGQFSAKGPGKVFSLVPLAEGMSIVVMLGSAVSIVFNNLYMSRLISYIIYTNFNVEPKSSSPDDYRMAWMIDCAPSEEERHHLLTCDHVKPGTLWNNTQFICIAHYYRNKLLKMPLVCDVTRQNMFARELFDWEPVVFLILVSSCTFLFLIKGIKTIGRSILWVYPAILGVLIIFLLYSVIQDGAINGIVFMITPEWSETELIFRNSIIATLHVLRTLNLDTGAMMAVASYAHFQSSAHYHAFFVCLVNVLVTLVFSCLVFCFAGIAAHTYHVSLDEMTPSRLGDLRLYGFIWIATGLSELWLSPLWGFVFILMLLWFGETTKFGQLLVILEPLYVYFDQRRVNRLLVNLLVVFAFFLLTLPVVTMDGLALYTFKFFTEPPLVIYPMMVVGLVVVTFIYCYGLVRIRQDIKFMLQYDPNRFFRVAWLGIPFLFLVMILFAIGQDVADAYEGEVYDDKWLVWLVFLAMTLPIVVMGLWNAFSFYKKGSLASVLRPRDEAKWSRASREDPSPTSPGPSLSVVAREGGTGSFIADLTFTRPDRTSLTLSSVTPSSYPDEGESPRAGEASQHSSLDLIFLISSDVKTSPSPDDVQATHSLRN